MLIRMSIKTETEYHPSKNTGSIRFYSGDNIMTEYICDSDGHISMSDRTISHENDIIQYHSGLKDTIRWVREIKKINQASAKQDLSKFKMDISIDENTITFTYRTILVFGNRKRERLISKIKYIIDEKKITFYARPAIRLQLVDFEQVVSYNFYLLRLLSQF